MVSSATLSRTLAFTLALTGLAAFVFSLFPGLDLAFSRIFHDPEDGFWLSRVAFMELLRRGFWNAMDLAGVFAIVLLVIELIRPRWSPIRPRAALFALSCFALDSGLLVDRLLKEHWGRARPRDITFFDGDLIFTPALTMSDQCQSNCSFVSGEASGIVTLCMLFLLLVVPCLKKSSRRPAIRLAVSLTALAALLRIAVGAHFLSDVIFAALFAVLISVSLYRVFGLHRVGVLRERTAGAPLPVTFRPGRRAKWD
ncbi:phosphatase PAP2 family protein [Sulfitobacter sp. LCG007]